MSLTDAVCKQKAFILMAGFHSLTDKLALGVCTSWPFREVLFVLKTKKSVCIRKEGANGLKTVFVLLQ